MALQLSRERRDVTLGEPPLLGGAGGSNRPAFQLYAPYLKARCKSCLFRPVRTSE